MAANVSIPRRARSVIDAALDSLVRVTLLAIRVSGETSCTRNGI